MRWAVNDLNEILLKCSIEEKQQLPDNVAQAMSGELKSPSIRKCFFRKLHGIFLIRQRSCCRSCLYASETEQQGEL